MLPEEVLDNGSDLASPKHKIALTALLKTLSLPTSPEDRYSLTAQGGAAPCTYCVQGEVDSLVKGI